jgi:DHA3 family macrolide efflux protein-like MFS transporter
MDLSMYKTLILNSNFRKIWIAQLLSDLGNSLYFASLMWLLWNATKSTVHSGFYAVVYDIPQLVLGLWIGVVIGRFSLKKVLILSDLIRVARRMCRNFGCHL